MVRISHDDVIEDFDFQKLTGSDEVASNLDVRFGRSRFTTRMIVLCDAPVYVQSSVRGAGVPVPSGKKGVPCLKANHSCRLNRTLPLAN